MVFMRFAAALLLLSSSLAAQKRPITHEDVWLMKRVRRARGQPGRQVGGRFGDRAGLRAGEDRLGPVDRAAGRRGAPRAAHPAARAAENGAVFSPDSRRAGLHRQARGRRRAAGLRAAARRRRGRARHLDFHRRVEPQVAARREGHPVSEPRVAGRRPTTRRTARRAAEREGAQVQRARLRVVSVPLLGSTGWTN